MITEYGKAVRKARITLGITMSQMANELKCSLAYLSAIENGKKQIPMADVKMTEAYFMRMGLYDDLNLKVLADISNKCIYLSNLEPELQELISSIAHAELFYDDLIKLEKFVQETKTRPPRSVIDAKKIRTDR